MASGLVRLRGVYRYSRLEDCDMSEPIVKIQLLHVAKIAILNLFVVIPKSRSISILHVPQQDR